MKNKKMTYGIIGLGRFGSSLAQKLAEIGAEILVVDKDEAKVAVLREYTENAYIASVLEKKTLSDMGFQNCDVVIVCIAKSIDVSILTVMKLQSLGVKRVIAKADSIEHGEILEKLGAEIVFPEQDMALRLANRLEMGQGLDFIELSESIRVTKLSIPANFVGKTIKEVDIRGKFGLNIIAIESKERVVDNIRPDYCFTSQDVLYLCGNKKSIELFCDWLDTHH